MRSCVPQWLIYLQQLVNGEYSKAWPIIGSLTRSVEYLQLNLEEQHREVQVALLSPSLPPKSENWIEEEERRRVFWNVFILERYVSAGTPLPEKVPD